MTESAPYAAPVPPAAPSAVTAEDPGKTLGIIGLILAFVAWPVGLILSFVAKSKSKKAGFGNTPAVIGIVVGFIALVITIAVVAFVAINAASLLSQCAEVGPGVYETSNGGTITCN
ncbi:MAG: DUF4190 domain-containing protein [Microbacteriaceae bacterium]